MDISEIINTLLWISILVVLGWALGMFVGQVIERAWYYFYCPDHGNDNVDPRFHFAAACATASAAANEFAVIAGTNKNIMALDHDAGKEE